MSAVHDDRPRPGVGRRRRAPPRVAVALLALAAAGPGPAAAEPARLRLRLEAGPEVDSNATRVEVAPGDPGGVRPIASPLGRVTGKLELGWRPRAGRTLRLAYTAGAKLFAEEAARSEDVFVQQGAASYTVRALEAVTVGATLDYYEAFQRGGAAIDAIDPIERDFRSLGGGLTTLLLGPGAHQVALSAGWRDFRYKPDAHLDFRGERIGLDYSTELVTGGDDPDQDTEAEWALAASYALNRRRYPNDPVVVGCDDLSQPACQPQENPALERRDLFHVVGARATYVRRVLFGLGYTLQANASNSFGQSLVRHVLEARVASKLPLAVFATLRGQLQLSRFPDPVIVRADVAGQSFVSIDDDNRNSLALTLERELAPALALEARYALYAGELSGQAGSFRRQVAFVGLAYTLDK